MCPLNVSKTIGSLAAILSQITWTAGSGQKRPVVTASIVALRYN